MGLPKAVGCMFILLIIYYCSQQNQDMMGANIHSREKRAAACQNSGSGILITTECTRKGTEYECRCEPGYTWSADECKEYKTCGTLNDDNTCGCLKVDLKKGLACRLSVTTTVVIKIVDPENPEPPVNSVCTLNNTRYECRCPAGYVWSAEECKRTGACDDINIDNTCGCITGVSVYEETCQLKTSLSGSSPDEPNHVPPYPVPLSV